jgi:hypothetical protein
MQSFEEIRAHIAAKHPLRINDPYLICFDVALERGQRHQGLYLAELNDESGHTYLRVSTPIGPLTGLDARRCLRFNWEQRVGFLAVSDLDGSPYLHLCENRPYELLNAKEIDRLIDELGSLGDKLEQVISQGDDSL